ncbi:cobyrinic acid a,c-diamide synthase [Rhodococcus sp. 14-2496-1d]|uniref:cobyrinate a,c-diamide synthase n=1 Tax=unclassified Rhodococcus (in: high G+C Gram-positive bacteria) TaxID=192944 RepID=UPI000B9B620C|nr:MULTISPECIES: cobyrinate a,c-diamide synthase [unclassified Rhodococcus (in: high G+C Gram-positive bacteria)]OZE06072.1 cobyrinic acid a,c-diamide synthase [Rhodococcus sp. 05-2255-3B1]OZE09281.1 cobyrinic acid a,c-diamide synthase [Rhodococcus sp. 05-2255-3C]OZE18225.1 cobyrinic acid a,c-diamide synthase [Rhodococcus sp. 05-2255-2A2]OZF26735.1 cobyrinic acid a,c-diamide synthase [Rhodococcus sp. 14-2496-1d]
MVTPSCPAVVIAAPASGSGKTTVATGLMGALRSAGRTVAPFKVGPDYIDPGYHSLAAGLPGRNLDAVMVGADRIGPLFRHGSRGCDIAVVEGVMGLFDGKIDMTGPGEASAEGSTARVAAMLGAPVILVVDARGHSQSLAAVLHGFSTFDASVRIGGVILNRVGSQRHEDVLRQACERVGVPVLGALPRMSELVVPSRHLGLITAVEHGGAATDAVDAMSALVSRFVDIEAVSALARSSVTAPQWSPEDEVRTCEGSPVIAVAGGPAFTFGYTEHVELLRAAGADVAVFDPLRDGLPTGTAGVVLPGGFPEEHAAALSANEVLLADIRAAAAQGLPIHAECAGLLYLARRLDGHAMAGVVDVDAEFGNTLTLGYRDAVALESSTLFDAGTRVTGHEFHRTKLVVGVEPAGTNRSRDVREAVPAAWGWHRQNPDGRTAVREGFVQGGVHASYLHTHAAGNSESITRFVSAAVDYARV